MFDNKLEDSVRKIMYFSKMLKIVEKCGEMFFCFLAFFVEIFFFDSGRSVFDFDQIRN